MSSKGVLYYCELSGLRRGQHLLRVVLLIAVGAEPGVGRQHILQLQAVAHQQARPAEAPLRRVAAAALRLPCTNPSCSGRVECCSMSRPHGWQHDHQTAILSCEQLD